MYTYVLFKEIFILCFFLAWMFNFSLYVFLFIYKNMYIVVHIDLFSFSWVVVFFSDRRILLLKRVMLH